jgi:hypothetical protein
MVREHKALFLIDYPLNEGGATSNFINVGFSYLLYNEPNNISGNIQTKG